MGRSYRGDQAKLGEGSFMCVGLTKDLCLRVPTVLSLTPLFPLLSHLLVSYRGPLSCLNDLGHQVPLRSWVPHQHIEWILASFSEGRC